MRVRLVSERVLLFCAVVCGAGVWLAGPGCTDYAQGSVLDAAVVDSAASGSSGIAGSSSGDAGDAGPPFDAASDAANPLPVESRALVRVASEIAERSATLAGNDAEHLFVLLGTKIRRCAFPDCRALEDVLSTNEVLRPGLLSASGPRSACVRSGSPHDVVRVARYADAAPAVVDEVATGGEVLQLCQGPRETAFVVHDGANNQMQTWSPSAPPSAARQLPPTVVPQMVCHENGVLYIDPEDGILYRGVDVDRVALTPSLGAVQRFDVSADDSRVAWSDGHSVHYCSVGQCVPTLASALLDAETVRALNVTGSRIAWVVAGGDGSGRLEALVLDGEPRLIHFQGGVDAESRLIVGVGTLFLADPSSQGWNLYATDL